MTTDQIALLNLIGLGLGNPFESEMFRPVKDWPALMSLAFGQQVEAVASKGMEALSDCWRGKLSEADEERLYALIGHRMLNAERYAMYKKTLTNLAKWYESHGFKTLLLKGYGLSLNWAEPDLRPTGDIDIYLFGRQQEADKAMAEELGIEISRFRVGHHTNYTYEGLSVENHTGFITTTAQGKRNRNIEQQLEAEATTGLRKLDCGIYAPSATFNAMYLIVHMAGHFCGEGITLRQLCDWMMFLQKEGQHVDWQKVNDFYSAFGYTNFVNAINSILVQHMGMPPAYGFDVTVQDMVTKNRILEDLFKAKVAEKCHSRAIRKIKEYISTGWKYRLLNKSTFAELVRTCYHYMLHPSDYQEQKLTFNY